MADSLDIWESGNPGIWKSGNLESPKIGKMEILRMQICSAQKNVGKVWIIRKKPLGPHVVPFQGIFPWAGKKIQKMPISLGGPMGPIHLVWGHVLVSFRISVECSVMNPVCDLSLG